MTNSQVAENWSNNLPGKSGTMKTDGDNLYSYDLRIGLTLNGEKILIPYLSRYNNFISQTTSKHVGLAQQYCHITALTIPGA